MVQQSLNVTYSDGGSEVLWEDGERVFSRGWRLDDNGNRLAVLLVAPAADHPARARLDRLTHEYELKDELDGAWAARPLALMRDAGRTVLVLDDLGGGEPLDRLLGGPMEVGRFLRLAIAVTSALDKVHQRGLIHKDIKPANIVVDCADQHVRLTGFGIASRLSRERQAPEPPETIAGTLAYMAPEQTGRMNRSIDARSDLYALGVTLYQMLTGVLPFTAADPMEWVHCHIARKPVPPGERLEGVPAPVSAIIMKLLAKTPEDRYQTAGGVERDLRRCLAEWEALRRIDDFPLGLLDTPNRLLIPEKLYGRDREIATLLSCFDRIIKTGVPELVLVSGYSGIGKSSVVNELHKVLVPPRGLFASGKFDQYKRDIPYTTFAQAFGSLVRPLLGKEEEELSIWRDAFRQALGPNAELIIDLVPELKLIIGEQPPVPVLPPLDAQRRFQLVFGRFIAVFARPEHPLTLFLDDLQWLDAATLDLLEYLLSRQDLQYMMLICAYRDNEVDSAHPLTRRLESIRKAGAVVQEITLAPLACEHLGQLIADSLHCEPERATSLAQLVHEKTAGNPFFANQFIYALAEEALLFFDHCNARWSWDVNRIRAEGYTDNVVDLMVGKLTRLPVRTQNALQQLACLGNSADFALLTKVYGGSKDVVHRDLLEAVRVGLVLHSESAYSFLHDRVQEAAYSLIPETARAEAHIRIGRLLAVGTPPTQIEEKIFDIVNQLNRGSHLIVSDQERERVAELNLIAGRRAKISTAYTSALSYLAVGRAFLTEQSWDYNYELIFAIECLTAECELLTASKVAAETRLSMLARRARRGPDTAAVTRLRLTLYTTLDQSDRGLEICLEYLQRGGIDWSLHPTRIEVQREYDRIWSQLGSRQIEELVDLPLMSDPDLLATLDILAEFPAMHIEENLSSLVVCRMVNLSLEYGNSDGSCFAYAWFAQIAGPRFSNYQDGFRFGRLGYELVEKRGLKRYQARTYMSFGNIVMPWAKHVLEGRDLVRRAFATADRTGDITFAGYSCNHLITNCLAAGDPLAEVQREAERGFEYAQKVRFGFVIDNLAMLLGFIRTLSGLTPTFGSFNHEGFDELRFERHLASNPVLKLLEFRYWVRKLQARIFAADYASAMDASLRAQQLLWTSPSHFETAEYCFYSALGRAAVWNSASPDEKQEHFEALVAHRNQLEVWAARCAENFENRAALVGAEIARMEGRVLNAEELYDKAIREARKHGFVHNQAIANEIAGRFYAERGQEKIAATYLRAARACYLRWGADGKVRQLEELYPHLKVDKDSPATIVTPFEQLDLATVIRVSEAVSGEIVFEKLINTLMSAAIEHAGADRGLLILPRADKYQIEAEAIASSDNVTVVLKQARVTTADLPSSVFHYVLRTKTSVLLHDASSQNPFSADDYIRDHRSRSVLCLPILKQTRLIGLLYLENTLTTAAFTPTRMAVLTLLASQAAISIENANLYRELAEREARIRRLVDANIIGILFWDIDGRIIDANEAFLRITGYGRDDVVSGRLRWRDLTPTEWRDADDRRMAELEATGTALPYEKEYFRKSGSRVPVLVGAATFGGRSDQGVAFVVDLTERKRAEQEIRESERRYGEVQMELVHANRVATLGQLSASIAHEVNQPIGATLNNTSAALHWLSKEPADLEKARQALNRIFANGNRVSDVVARMRALFKKAPLRKENVDINAAILEVITLTRGEIVKNGISVKSQLADDLPLIRGDRVQLQQVIMNLIMNAVEALSAVSEGARELVITTHTGEPSGVLVVVRDSGPGLSSEGLERIFDAFNTTKPGGLGMGLSICRTIIEAHGGGLWATAAQPQGASFQFTVPEQSNEAA
ncbi:ATP-binding sensor histidine kinase [Bradyrhizobium sp. 17]|uniref:trifunctional serine/threonine-protein kinase/ATP-binding protein/sensor histidine kinase n=1 Tax=Bradyrhizobium sp. 17 TaxID=2782649 RepID=UPI001FFBB191|nr:ATP-binding sensor histidine kinase [Bradyrhizobium sp. 17]MCK1525132.1 AAA family ATPase [Bradyrhizobium sp. 17]